MKEKWFTVLSRYKFPAIMLLLGVVLMLLPLGKKTAVATQETPSQEFDLEAMERQMEEIVGCIDGVGRVKVMLTLRTGPTLSLASDKDETLRDAEMRTENQILKLNRGSGMQEVVITQQRYPVFQGAVIVCDGAGNSAVRLQVTEAVSVLTSLSSDKITVAKWQS
ncbi:MAG: stage III sporulation protein AG [Oscillospiraceae bacterium]|nr:stage III sporulation protein AG [Oscillospiraceae bacterium]